MNGRGYMRILALWIDDRKCNWLSGLPSSLIFGFVPVLKSNRGKNGSCRYINIRLIIKELNPSFRVTEAVILGATSIHSISSLVALRDLEFPIFTAEHCWSWWTESTTANIWEWELCAGYEFQATNFWARYFVTWTYQESDAIVAK